MTPTTLTEKPSRSPRPHAPRAARPLTRAARLSAREPRDPAAAHHPAAAHGPLACYTDAEGRLREVLARPGHAGSVLVVDRDAATLADRRLVAHLAADEPVENAGVVCRDYLRDPRGRRCRPLTAEDLLVSPFAEECAQAAPALGGALWPQAVQLFDRRGDAHRLEAFDAGMSIPELRWRRLAGATASGETPDRSEGDRCESGGRSKLARRPESVRDVVGYMESYEPVRTLTAEALARHREDPAVSVAVLGAELQRLDASRIVLNRGLRRAVLVGIRIRGLSLSEIAFRCGRVKRDCKGNASGETSWLARRVGISPESGGGEPTPWIHSEVLAVIARHGLGVSPHEVEL
jgi:hypothetical protein